MNFSSLTFTQLENLERRAIRTNDNTMRFTLLKAAKGEQAAQRKVMSTIEKDPTWLERV